MFDPLSSEAAALAQSKPRPEFVGTAKPRPRGISPEASAVFDSAQPLDGTLGSKYLRSARKCGIPGHHCCRFVPALRHHKSGSNFPAIISLVTDAVTGVPLTLQMSFLALDGMSKAPIEPSRLFWPGLPVAGGVVRLSPDDQVETGLAITEGLEDALSIIDHGWEPVWACLSAGSIANFPVLAGIEALTIFADADDAGRRAATKCMERWTAAGREVTVMFPYGAAKDFNEAAMTSARV